VPNISAWKAVRTIAGRRLDLVLAERHRQAALVRRRVRKGDERALSAEEAGLHQRPLGPLGLLVEVDLLDVPNLASVAVVQLLAAVLGDVDAVGHGVPPEVSAAGLALRSPHYDPL
jgi:hypothetical protein